MNGDGYCPHCGFNHWFDGAPMPCPWHSGNATCEACKAEVPKVKFASLGEDAYYDDDSGEWVERSKVCDDCRPKGTGIRHRIAAN